MAGMHSSNAATPANAADKARFFFNMVVLLSVLVVLLERQMVVGWLGAAF
jgi:hypothetical protein